MEPIRILIIDDETDKQNDINECIEDRFKEDEVSRDISLNIADARKKMEVNYYDLVILDLVIAEKYKGKVDTNNGIDYLEDIFISDIIRKPLDVIILSGKTDAKDKFKCNPSLAGFHFVEYEVFDNAWKDAIISRIEFIQAFKESWRIELRRPKCDIAIITAVPVESSGVKKLGLAWKEINFDGDPYTYLYASTNDEKSVVMVQLSRMGMASAAMMTTKLLKEFSPKYIFMTGIAAGLDDSEMNLGDIIIGTELWDYCSGKYQEDKERGIIFKPDPKYVNMKTKTENMVRKANNPDILNEIRETYLEMIDYDELTKPEDIDFVETIKEQKLKVHFGPIACGAAVVASEKIVSQMVTNHSRHTIGLDMESFGVAYVLDALDTDVIPIIIKSVSDMANKNKCDVAQKYAAYTSAKLALHIIENIEL